MTRLLTCGFETGDALESGTTTVGSGGAIAIANSSPAPRGGNYYLKVSYVGTSTWAATYKAFALPTAKTDVWVRFAVNVQQYSPVNNWPLIQFNDSTGAAQILVGWNLVDGLMRIYRGASTLITVGTGPSIYGGAWHVIEARCQILTATTGAVEVWVDGSRVINFSGDTTNTATLNIGSILLGTVSSLSLSDGIVGSQSFSVCLDDVAINDTSGTVNNGRPGDGRVVWLSPSADAAGAIQFSRGGTDSGANWSQVEELPPSMTDYVYSATAAQRDLYTMTDLPGGLSVASINVVEALALCQNSDAGAGSVGLTIRSGGTVNEGAAQTLGTGAAYLRQVWELNPNGSVAWTAAAVNAVEAGVTCR